MRYREWCLKPDWRRGIMLPLKRVAEMTKAPDAGYASVYEFDEEAARQILDQKSSVGLARFPVYTDNLTIDLDNGESQLKQAVQSLAVLGLGYQVWESGGKGFHIVIPLTCEVSGLNVPYSQRKWVEALGIGADLSLYQHGRVISLPGRKHPKTGVRKKLVRTILGKALELTLLEQPAPVFAMAEEGEVGELAAGLWKAFTLATNEPGPGNRHTALWSTAKHLADAGLAYETTLDILTQVNESWQESKTTAEVETAVRQAYRK